MHYFYPPFEEGGQSTNSYHSFPSQGFHILKWNLVYRFIWIRSRQSYFLGMIEQFLTLELKKIPIICIFFSDVSKGRGIIVSQTCLFVCNRSLRIFFLKNCKLLAFPGSKLREKNQYVIYWLMFDIAIYSMCDTFWHVWCHVYWLIHVQLVYYMYDWKSV